MVLLFELVSSNGVGVGEGALKCAGSYISVGSLN